MKINKMLFTAVVSGLAGIITSQIMTLKIQDGLFDSDGTRETFLFTLMLLIFVTLLPSTIKKLKNDRRYKIPLSINGQLFIAVPMVFIMIYLLQNPYINWMHIILVGLVFLEFLSHALLNNLNVYHLSQDFIYFNGRMIPLKDIFEVTYKEEGVEISYGEKMLVFILTTNMTIPMDEVGKEDFKRVMLAKEEIEG